MFQGLSEQKSVEVDSILAESKARLNSIPPNSRQCEPTDLTRRVYDAVIEYKLKHCLTEVERVVAKGESKLTGSAPTPESRALVDRIWEVYQVRADLLRTMYEWKRLGLRQFEWTSLGIELLD